MTGRLARRTPLDWLQLRHRPGRLAVALAGVVFADVLIFMQLGVMGALFETAVKPVRLLKADVLLLSPEAKQLAQLGTLPRRRLYQALAVPGVEAGATLQLSSIAVRDPSNPAEGSKSVNLSVFGIDPAFDGFQPAEIAGQRHALRAADTALVDQQSREPFAAVAARLARGEPTHVEVGGRTLRLVGLFSLGASFESDGSMIVSDQTFLRLFPRTSASAVAAVLLRTEPSADPTEVAARLRDALPAADTMVITIDAYISFIKDFMASNTPIGTVFSFGVVIGFVIGFAIVYQVLSADVNDHLREYATLRAMGYAQRFLLGVVFEEALLLAALGFVPALGLSLGLYAILGRATELAIGMPWSRPATVLGLTFAMCCVSGAVATLRLKDADPADVF